MVIDVGLYLPTLVSEYYVDTTFSFAYDPWGLVRPLPGPVTMHLVYVAMAVAGALIALGLWYRRAAACFFVLTTYVFLIDSTYYQNHEYLICMLSLWLVVIPAHRMWSLDARRRPELASTEQPAWVLWFLRFTFGVPYVFGGIAKLNADWLAAEPLRLWLHDRTHVPVIGPLFHHEPVVWFAAYGSMLLDLTVVGFLLHRRTRVPAFVIAVTFHLINARLFGLFVFPWLMIAATTLFFAPDWPLQVRAWWRARRTDGEAAAVSAADAGAVLVGAPPAAATTGTGSGSAAGGGSVSAAGAGSVSAGAGSGASPGAGSHTDGGGPEPPPATFDGTIRGCGGRRRLTPALAVVLVLWVTVQVTVPFRHLVIPGDANWTEEGHRFAWHMMLRTKSGDVTFTVDDGERTWIEDPADHLSGKQVQVLAGHPERLARFAHHLSERYDGAEVRAETSVALNGRPRVPIVDPDLDLASVRVPWWGHAVWILPNPEPLPRR